MRVGSWRAAAQEAYRISERHAARIVKLAIGTLRYESRKIFDEVLRHRLRQLAGMHVRYGYRSFRNLTIVDQFTRECVGVRSEPFDDRDEGRASPRTRVAATRQFAGKHYGG